MNEIKIFNNPVFGTVRTVMIDGEPWFVGVDVARALGYSKVYDALNTNVNEMDTTTVEVTDTMGRLQSTGAINESGLYDLVFESRLPSAKGFRHWVTSEVLPSIRKTGGYISPQAQDSYTIEDPVERAKRWIEEQGEKKLLKIKVTEMQPKAELCDKLLDASLLVNFRDAAKEIGISQSQFTGWLKEITKEVILSSAKANPINSQKTETGSVRMTKENKNNMRYPVIHISVMGNADRGGYTRNGK